MISTETWPQSAVRVWTLAQRFQKFLVVGVFGLAVNEGMLFVFKHLFGLPIAIASPIAIFISMVVTFALNEFWTWHDRGNGRLLNRALMYGVVNSGGLLINYAVLALLVRETSMHYLMANLVGAGVAAVWNFGLNNMITWRA